LDQAQITSLARHVLTSLGTALAGTGVAGWFTESYINIAVMIIGAIAAVVGTVWGNRSNTPQALARKLVDNSSIPNATIAKAIADAKPEKLAGQS